MSTVNSFVKEIEQAIAGGDPERRSGTLRRLTELFVGNASRLKDDHVTVFDEVIIRLAREVDATARIELSGRLADIGNAPANVVKDLAHDADAAVAEPVLERSMRLTEDDLLSVAGLREQDHLLAVSRRRTLSESVADVLVKRGDQRVLRTVVQNDGAKLSARSLASLVQKALADNDLRGMLLKRPDLPGEPLRMLAEPAEAKTAQKPSPEAAAEMRRMEASLAKLMAAMTSPTTPSGRDITFALERLARTAKGKAVEEVRAANWIRADKIDDALAAIAHNAQINPITVVRAYETVSYEPLLLVVRAAGYSWNTFKLLFTARDGKAPPAAVVKTSFEGFQQLSVADAQRLGRLITSREAEAATHAAA
jgi:uncharacterized protein (DUF2336 family)